MTKNQIVASLRAIAWGMQDGFEAQKLNEIASLIEELQVTVLEHSADEEYPAFTEILMTFPVPVRRVKIDHASRAVDDSGFILPLLGEGYSPGEQEEIVQIYLGRAK